MNSVVTGLVWCAREADGLSEDHWSNFPGIFATIADVSQGGEPLLLWADGQMLHAFTLIASTGGEGKAVLDFRGALRCGSPFSWTPSWASTTFHSRSLRSHTI